jgi:hypothetical protein
MHADSVWLIIIASVVVASIVFGIKRMRLPLWPRSQSTSVFEDFKISSKI